MRSKLRVTIWNEFCHEKTNDTFRTIYPSYGSSIPHGSTSMWRYWLTGYTYGGDNSQLQHFLEEGVVGTNYLDYDFSDSLELDLRDLD
jgi:hypothetical protein